MTAPKFKWFVIDHIDRQGIWFRSTQGSGLYVFYWNPLKFSALYFVVETGHLVGFHFMLII